MFEVDDFGVGSAGLDLSARIKPEPVMLGGLDVPLRFDSGGVTIRNSIFAGGSLTGSGQLPRGLVGEANASIALSLASVNNEVVIESAEAKLDKSGDPIVCESTRFKLSITELGLGFVREGSYHFYFQLTGTAVFDPGKGDAVDGLLKHLPNLEIKLDKAPLTSYARVLMRHISFQVRCVPPKIISFFDVFDFELRGFGFLPSSQAFDGDPAISIAGQVKFARGDKISAKFDFHQLYIGMPKAPSSFPRVRFDGLTVGLSLGGVAEVEGTAIAVDGKLPDLFQPRTLPSNVTANGFLASGRIDIQGWASMSASMGFLELSKTGTSERRNAAFFYLQKNKLSDDAAVELQFEAGDVTIDLWWLTVEALSDTTDQKPAIGLVELREALGVDSEAQQAIRLFVRQESDVASPSSAQPAPGEWRLLTVWIGITGLEPVTKPDGPRLLALPRRPRPVDATVEAFERPAHVEFAALDDGKEVETGRLHVFKPGADADLKAIETNALLVVRDVKRRVATRLTWHGQSASLKLADRSTLPGLAKLVGGYDLFVQDPDLLPAEPKAALSDETFTRMGRVTLMPASMRGLMPAEFGDLSRIEASYPSEAQLLKPGKKFDSSHAATGTLHLGPWFSSAESTALMPEPALRRSLFAMLDENLFSALFAKGRPDLLRVPLENWPNVAPSGQCLLGPSISFRNPESASITGANETGHRAWGECYGPREPQACKLDGYKSYLSERIKQARPRVDSGDGPGARDPGNSPVCGPLLIFRPHQQRTSWPTSKCSA